MGIGLLLLGIVISIISHTIIVGLLLLGLSILMFRGRPRHHIYQLDNYETIIYSIPQEDVALKLYQSIEIAKSRHKAYEEQKLYEELERM